MEIYISMTVDTILKRVMNGLKKYILFFINIFLNVR